MPMSVMSPRSAAAESRVHSRRRTVRQHVCCLVAGVIDKFTAWHDGGNGLLRALDSDSRSRGHEVEFRSFHYHGTTLCMSFTNMILCHQALHYVPIKSGPLEHPS